METWKVAAALLTIALIAVVTAGRLIEEEKRRVEAGAYL